MKTQARQLMSIMVLLSLLTLAFPGVSTAQTSTSLAADYDSELARSWFDLQLRLVTRTWGFSPPVAARAFGYTSVALYEAVVAGMPGYQSLSHQLNELSALPQPELGRSYHWPTVANSALATITRLLFPTANSANKAAIETLYGQMAEQYQGEIDQDSFSRSVEYGQAVAEAIFQWSETDGGHEGFRSNYPEYELPAGDGLWQPTLRAKGNPQPALQPYWGKNRPFVLTSGEECAPPPPPTYSKAMDSKFFAEALAVYQAVEDFTPEQLEIARFWADDPFRTATPAGHWIAILSQVLEREAATLDVAAEAYAKLGIAVADAFIGCWNVKYQYNLIRPVTYIQNVIDPAWHPILITPQFPEYPSGHSVVSGASAHVLTSLFGADYAFIDHTHDAWGLAPRSFDSFLALAEEAAMSRIYGGIHFPSAVQNGLAHGECIAEQVVSLQFRTGTEAGISKSQISNISYPE